MYKYLLVVVILISCNPKPAVPVQNLSKAPASNYNAWGVNKGIATAMIKSAQDKACNAFSVTNENPSIRQEIDSAYPASKYNRTWIQARYLPDADEAKYRSLRGLPPGSPFGSIRGYCTRLYSIKPLNLEGQSEDIYFDILTVCPPPPDCDRDSLLSSKDTAYTSQ
jgi:hypothetical protein